MELKKGYRLLSVLCAWLLASCGGGGSGASGGGMATQSPAAIVTSLSAASISAGQRVRIDATPEDSQGNPLTSVGVTWQSSDPAVATVDAGVVTGLAQGSTTVTARAGSVASSPVQVSVGPASGAPGSLQVPEGTALPVVSVTDHSSYWTLATSNGGWNPAPASYEYRWTRNAATIPGATLASYDTSTADVGADLAAVVTAVNSAGRASATSAAVRVQSAAGGPPVPGQPTLGAHGLAYHVSRGSRGATLSIGPMTTQSGSTMLAFVGKGSVFNLSPPSDNKGNSPYLQLGSIHEYTLWPGEGTAVYAFNEIAGGANHVVSVDDSNAFDEVSFAAVEVKNGGLVQDIQWNEVLDSPTQTSRNVTTTGPATLVAVWYGDDASSVDSNPVPGNGFTVIDGVGGAVETVQMFVATRDVGAAGSYNVTWTTTPRQGAQLYLLAVQKP